MNDVFKGSGRGVRGQHIGKIAEFKGLVKDLMECPENSFYDIIQAREIAKLTAAFAQDIVNNPKSAQAKRNSSIFINYVVYGDSFKQIGKKNSLSGNLVRRILHDIIFGDPLHAGVDNVKTERCYHSVMRKFFVEDPSQTLARFWTDRVNALSAASQIIR